MANPACLKLNIANHDRGDHFINIIKDTFHVALNRSVYSSNAVTFTISFDIGVSSDSKGSNIPIKQQGFLLDESEEKELLEGKITYLEIKNNEFPDYDSDPSYHYIIESKQIPQLEITQNKTSDGKLTETQTLGVSLILLNYWFGGGIDAEGKGELPGAAGTNNKPTGGSGDPDDFPF